MNNKAAKIRFMETNYRQKYGLNGTKAEKLLLVGFQIYLPLKQQNFEVTRAQQAQQPPGFPGA